PRARRDAGGAAVRPRPRRPADHPALRPGPRVTRTRPVVPGRRRHHRAVTGAAAPADRGRAYTRLGGVLPAATTARRSATAANASPPATKKISSDTIAIR